MDIVTSLLNSDSFMPHGHCYLWRPDILWMHVGSDGLIALSYFAIPFALVHLVRKRKDLAFNWVFVLFAAFILACGMTHLMSIWTVWNPQYAAEGVLKVITAVVSLGTAIALVPLMPKAIVLPSLTQLKKLNEDLTKEIKERRSFEKLQSVHLAVSRILTEAKSMSEAFSQCLETVSVGLEWDYGAVWIIAPQGAEICIQSVWKSPLKEPIKFDDVSRLSSMVYGEGIPGKIWKSREPIWLSMDHGGSTLAFPMIAGTECVGVLEFQGRQSQQPNEKILEMIADIGTRIGSFILRKRAEDELRALYLDLELRVEQRTAELLHSNEILKETQREVLRNAERMKSVVDHVVDGIITINTDCQIETWNPAAKKIFGYQTDEVIGKNVKILMPEPFQSEHDQYLLNYLQSRQAKVIGIGREVVGRRKDGSTFPLDLAVSEFNLNSQQFFTGIVRDITDRKQAAIDLKNAKEAAEIATKAKSSFLANMSHEIRTPLAAVLGFSELLARPELSDSDKGKFVAAIKRNSDLLLNIINDILDLSKVEAGKLEIDWQDVSLPEIMLDVAQILNLKASGKGIQLSIESEPDVPSMVRTDSLRLRQILLNIIGNAIKFTHQGGVSVHLKLIQQDITKLAFIVKDTGIGIAADQTHELFQAFSQADVSTKRKYGGTGLGLILSKRLANLLGGDIVLTESRLGEGSTFTITIDPGLGSSVQKTSVELLDSTILKLAENDQMSLRLVGVSVLLVEDSQDIMQLVGRILLEAGAKVDYANNGKEALARAHNSKFDVILMDLQMPVMDGYEATAQLRKEGYKAPIIAVSAHALKEEHESCLAAGFASHISKPIDGNKLLELIAKPTSRD